MRVLSESIYHHVDRPRPGHPAQMHTFIYDALHPDDASEGPFGHANEWILDYTLSGSILTRVGSDSSPWRIRQAGQAHLYPPGCRFWERKHAESGIVHSAFVVFSGGQWLGMQPYIQNEAGYCCFYDTQSTIHRLFKQWSQLIQEKYQDSFWLSQSCLYQLADTLSQFSLMDSAWQRTDDAAHASISAADLAFEQQVRTLLHANYAIRISFDEIAEAMGISRSTLSHKYKRVSGESPRDTLNAIRIHAIKVLILKREKLRNIALQTGLNDEFHLSKYFKKQTGLSPRQFFKSNTVQPEKNPK